MMDDAVPRSGALNWKKVWSHGYDYFQLFDDTEKLIGEVEEHHEAAADRRLFDATDCRERPYRDLGQYRSLGAAKEAVLRAIEPRPRGKSTNANPKGD